MGVLVISFDSLGDKVFQAMAADSERYPNVAAFKQQAFYRGGVKTIFVSNTYPIHTTISTGKLPKDHGIVSNLLPPKKSGERAWAQMAKYIRAKTIWDAAREKKLTTAAVLWPVTCGAKIDYHIPEVHPEKGQNILFRSLRYGSAFLQLSALAKHSGKIAKAVRGIARGTSGQPELDAFSTAAACDILNRKKPDLALVHLIAYDTLFHFFSSQGPEIDAAKQALDTNLGKLLENASDYTVIVFSDHAQLDVSENINLDDLYDGAVFEQCGGSAFLNRAIEGIENQPFFQRYLSKDEMRESGYADKPVLGIAAKPGYAFSGSDYKGNHGYPVDYEDYEVFYAVKGKNFAAGSEHKWLKNHLTDITAIIARELNLDMDILTDIQ